MSDKELDLLEANDEELIVQSPLERNWRGTIIALMVIAVMCSLIALTTFLLTPYAVGGSTKRALTLDDVLGRGGWNPTETMTWISEDVVASRRNDVIESLNVSNDPPTRSVLVPKDVMAEHGKVSSWVFSADGKYLSLTFEEQKRPRSRIYKLVKLDDVTFESVGPNRSGGELIQLFAWNSVGHDYAFVYNNDIYYNEGPHSNRNSQLTRTGNEAVYNGISDWIYEEEIFQTPQALWWSNSGNYLAYLTIDDRNVSKVFYSSFQGMQYPDVITVPYPKSGVTDLPKITLSMWSKASNETKKMNIALHNISNAVYIFSANWVTIREEDLLIAVFTNRYQNVVSITLCTFESGKCVLNLETTYKVGDYQLWAEPDQYRIQYYKTESYFVLLPHHRPNGNVYTQVAEVTVPRGLKNGRIAFLHADDFDVVDIVGYNRERDEVYFLAAAPKPTQRHMYSASAVMSIRRDTFPAKCLTCNVSLCHNQAVSFSSNMDDYVIECVGRGVTESFLSSLSRNNTFGVPLASNTSYIEKAGEIYSPESFEDNVTLPDGFLAFTKIFLPRGVRRTTVDRKYPAIVSVYAGPGTQRVTEEMMPFSFDFYLLSNLSAVLVFIDGRGSAMRGWRYKQPIYGKLGTVEVDDQILAIRTLAKKYPFIDSHRIGVWGWSYGGFATIHAIERDNKKTFKCAVSVAPVTNFRYYDATYTERYMGAASELAYEKTDATRNVTNFRNIKYLLVHGLSDDNVHLQNTAQMIQALVQENIQFSMMVYPDARHAIVWARKHLFTRIRDFFHDCFYR
ncbi:hypothetical protein AB6A40_001846 [Gnathostoma spinigerum]|uniref:Uncharacterized protein n=1 Tax=Gnathostoma spinigerum TaxID=75299 RepID=A0ABD6EEM4_9BILA